jgi:mono/diheme cytochrome c family protein
VRRLAVAIAAVIAVLGGAGTGFYLVFSGPRMTAQPHILAYQRIAPAPPAGTVPREEVPRLPAEAAARTLANPVAPTEENVARGKAYYGYYCLFCHGTAGAGDGPVGTSYVPPPADLRTERVRTMPDGQLLRAMLTGTGHGKVLERVVPPDWRWHLALYVRALAAAGPGAASAGGSGKP